MNWIDQHKGVISFVAAALCFAVGLTLHAFEVEDGGVVLAIGEAALVGAICDWIALHALFHKRWYFPGSGVIPRNRANIARGLRHMTQSLIEDQLRTEVDALDFHGLIEGLLSDGTSRSGRLELKPRPSLASETFGLVLRRLEDRVQSEEFLAFIADRIAERAGQIANLANSLGVVRFQAVASQISYSISNYLEQLRTSTDVREAALKRLQSEVQKLLHQEEDEAVRELRDRFNHQIVPQLAEKAGELVEKKLEAYGDERVRDLFYEKTGRHLDWIRVNGAAWGGIIGFLFWLGRRLV